MSINFTSDIDGATSGSGITKIKVGGKTINLSEVSSGGGSGNGVASGSFTPEAQATGFTIDTGIDFTFLMVSQKTATIGLGYRTYVGVIVDIQDDLVLIIGTNAGGNAFTASVRTWSEYSDIKLNDVFKFVKNGTSYISTHDVTNDGYMAPTEYIWYAW